MRSPVRILVAGILIALGPAIVSARAAEATCADVAARGRLNVLTLNLLFSEIQFRDARLDAIASFIAAQPAAARPDVILLQEVVSGLLVGTADSSLDLKQKLLGKGLPYNHRSRFLTGIPGLLFAGNAVLSRCEILATFWSPLPIVVEEPFPALNLKVPLPRLVMVTRLNVPQAGRVNVYNTHLCSFCDPGTQRLKQADAMLDFVAFVQRWFPAPVVLGGDLNIDRNLPGNSAVYDFITGQGFTDTYSQANSCAICCAPGGDLSGCTYGDPANPLVTGSPFPGPPARIDYLFTKGALDVKGSAVVFRPPAGPFVSDHMGLFTAVGRP